LPACSILRSHFQVFLGCRAKITDHTVAVKASGTRERRRHSQGFFHCISFLSFGCAFARGGWAWSADRFALKFLWRQ
jgi:hypothetical protein